MRYALFKERGEIQTLAYWTIIGRIDQFALGMLAYHARGLLAHRHGLAIATGIIFSLIYWQFNYKGGFFLNPTYPSPRSIWFFLPTIEGLAYAIGIAWYDNSLIHSTSKISRFIGKLGEYSYSIYLLHFFVVFHVARFIHENIMSLSNFYIACIWSLVAFVLMIIPAYISYRWIESPFLTFRRKYIKSTDSQALQKGAIQTD